jgi:hypothetical protein
MPTDTIGFEQPLFYTSSLVGWLVLAFKVIVGFALIGVFWPSSKPNGLSPTNRPR